jgi:ATP-dependent Clp protease ATP-binding subunit ClpC
MFERFTGRARHVVVLAQEEARLLNHNYIGTEHILLGLLGEPDSVGGQVLTSFGLTRDGAREEVLAKVGRGKKQLTGHIPFTPRAKKTLELSLREALAIKHNYIGTEHILLGLIREGDGVAAQILREHADLLEIRVAVLDAVAAYPGAGSEGGEAGEGGEDTNAVLRWLRARLTRHGATSLPFRPDVPGAELGTRGTPAAEAALQQAARLAGPLPVGSHHLMLAALADRNSAASAALASLGVDLDELRERLLSASVTGTSDEQPEQAGRRQMAIQVTDEILTVVLTDPVIVEAGKEALRAVNARAAARAGSAAGEGASDAGASGEPAGAGLAGAGLAGGGLGGTPLAGTGPSGEGASGEGASGEGASREEASATSTVIRGDNPNAVGLAAVWLELRNTLNTLANPLAGTRSVKLAEGPPRAFEAGGPGERSEADEPGEAGEADEAAS